MSETECCGTCRYYRFEQCRKTPPRLFDGGIAGHWPVVPASAWCGEYRPAETVEALPRGAEVTD